MLRFSPEERTRINDVTADALELPAENRTEFVRKQCPGGPVREEVLRLLQQAEPTVCMPTAVQDRGARAGETVGKFRLLQLMGEGATGEVYLAVRLDIGQRAAVKILRMAIRDPRFERHFEQEARLLAGLDHPNIVTLFDYGRTADGRPYLATEYVNGGNLRDSCDGHYLNSRGRIQLFLKVCEAVQYAHEQLLVHCDLKPDNILVDTRGEPKLLDFGVVRMLGLVENLSSGTEGDIGLPRGLGGTFEYASPEQLADGHISTASDVYSLGVVLYELLTGRVPLRWSEQGPETAWDFVSRVQRQKPPRPSELAMTEDVARRRNTSLNDLRHQLTGDLEAILSKALSKSPADRYGNARALAEDLINYFESSPVKARPGGFGYRVSKFARRRKYPLAAASLLAAAGIASGVWIWRQNQMLLAANLEQRQTISRIMQAAMSFEKGIDELERRSRPDDARRALAAAESQLKFEPTPDSEFNTARCQRIFAELLLRSSKPAERKEGYKLLGDARTLLASVRTKAPNYGGLEDEQQAIDAVETELRGGSWTAGGIGFAAESIPPMLSGRTDSLSDARLAKQMGDLWRALGDPARAVADYRRALASYDTGGHDRSPALLAERAECERSLRDIRYANP